MTKFTLKNSELKNIVDSVSDLAKANSPIPILSNIILKCENGIFKAQAGDGAAQITIKIKEMDSDFGIAIKAEKLKKLSSSFPDDQEIKFEIKDNKLFVKAEKTKITIQTLEANLFPVPTLEGEVLHFAMLQEDIKRHIQNVVHCMSHYDVHAWKNGVLFRNDEVLTVAATTGAEIGLSQQKIDAEKFDFVIPPAMASLVSKKMNVGPVEISLFENKIVFNFDDIEFIVPRKIETFQNVLRVIQAIKNPVVRFNKKDFMDASNRASINAMRSMGAFLKIENGEMEITCRDRDEESSDSFAVEYDGQKIEYAYNIDQLRSAINSIRNEKINLHIGGTMDGIAMIYADEQINIVTPMRI